MGWRWGLITCSGKIPRYAKMWNSRCLHLCITLLQFATGAFYLGDKCHLQRSFIMLKETFSGHFDKEFPNIRCMLDKV